MHWNSQFNRGTLYWLAAQTAQKAGRVDASIRKIAIGLLQVIMDEHHQKRYFYRRTIRDRQLGFLLDRKKCKSSKSVDVKI